MKTMNENIVIKRFMDHIFYSTNGCWYWTGSRNNSGYGIFIRRKKTVLAHRFSYELHKGPINGLNVCHSCDNPLCVNPDHLFIGTQKDNVTDMIKKNRAPNRKGVNHPRCKLSEDQVIAIRNSKECYRLLAEKFNIGKSAIAKIKSRQTWEHVEQAINDSL